MLLEPGNETNIQTRTYINMMTFGKEELYCTTILLNSYVQYDITKSAL